jgi:hypothetical protein
MCVLQSGQVPPVGGDPVCQRPEHALREQQHTSAVAVRALIPPPAAPVAVQLPTVEVRAAADRLRDPSRGGEPHDRAAATALFVLVSAR